MLFVTLPFALHRLIVTEQTICKNQNQKLLHFQSQFRFDNECYLNLPDNHKRVSLTPQVSLELAIEASNTEDNEDGNGSSVVARTPAASGANESNFNLVYDDFNLASVSMPLQFYFYLFILISFHFRLGCVPLDCLFACLISRSCYSFPPACHFLFGRERAFLELRSSQLLS